MTTTEDTRVEPEILNRIREADKSLTNHFLSKLRVNPDLTRALVSFQANKEVPGYRWFKFKEGFSASLVRYVLQELGIDSGRVIDPFAGSGAALFTASASGLDAIGIELLPVGCEIITARQDAFLDRTGVASIVQRWIEQRPWRNVSRSRYRFSHLNITQGAFPPANERHLEAYLSALQTVRHRAAKTLLRFAALCILEDISYTRKDGQYLRWDYRSGKHQGGRLFHKPEIRTFNDAIIRKLLQIKEDLVGQQDMSHGLPPRPSGNIEIIHGSCLSVLPQMPSHVFDGLMTSPPYCNRYDYTRTYALELAMLGINDQSVRQLRQAMLSCTVENREKEESQHGFDQERLAEAKSVFSGQELINHIVEYLETLREVGLLNNPGIPRMVKNYFWEMTLVILECARILKPGAPMIMVNDNVRYAGIPIPVDLILSRIAECAGFSVGEIWVLPRGKGNSSQQMGAHGREELRKCVYVWSKTIGASTPRARAPQAYATV